MYTLTSSNNYNTEFGTSMANRKWGGSWRRDSKGNAQILYLKSMYEDKNQHWANNMMQLTQYNFKAAIIEMFLIIKEARLIISEKIVNISRKR